MKPLIVLVAVFLLSALVFKLIGKQVNWALSGRVAMCAMLCFTAIGHFAFSEGMALMVPDIVPFKKELVYITGIVEVILGIGLLFPSFKVITGWVLILFFVLLLPANIKGAIDQVDYQKANFKGPGLAYLYFRVPLQVLFIAWTYLSTIRY